MCHLTGSIYIRLNRGGVESDVNKFMVIFFNRNSLPGVPPSPTTCSVSDRIVVFTPSPTVTHPILELLGIGYTHHTHPSPPHVHTGTLLTIISTQVPCPLVPYVSDQT
jgi:hypothetical protein